MKLGLSTLSRISLYAGVAAVALGLAGLPASDALADGKGQNAGASQKGQGAKGGKGGGKGSGSKRDVTRTLSDEGDDDSDRPEWAGRPGGPTTGGGKPSSAGSTKGDLFGDLWVILRDKDGVPILTPEGWVQPLDADGNLIPLDEEGHPVDDTATIEVEIGRLNVGRAPSNVLATRLDEVVAVLKDATAVTTDAAGRLVLTMPDGTVKTIDSPLENLAIYKELLTDGSIGDLTPADLAGTELDFLVDGVYDSRDLIASTTFIAAATDKTGTFTIDQIAYINAFLDINTVTSPSGVTYSVIDYTPFIYDRSDTYSGVTAEVLVQQPDGSWTPTTVDIYDAVFNSSDWSNGGWLSVYTLAAEDARMVIEYIHEYALPADSTN